MGALPVEPIGAAREDSGHERDSQIDPIWADSTPTTAAPEAAPRRHRSAIVAAAFGFALLTIAIALQLARWPTVPAVWRTGADGALVLAHSDDPALRRHIGHVVTAFRAERGPPLAADATLLPRSARWIVSDTARAQRIRSQNELARALEQKTLAAIFADGSEASAAISPRSLAGLGLGYWLLAALAGALGCAGVWVWLVRRTAAAAMYALLAATQAGNLLLMAAETLPSLGWAPGYARFDLGARTGLDLAATAALLGVCVAPAQLARRASIGRTAWALALAVALAAAGAAWPAPWWTTQALMLAGAGSAIIVSGRVAARAPRPELALIRRLTIAGSAALALLSLGLALTTHDPAAVSAIEHLGPQAWQLFLAALLMLVPFTTGSRAVARELTLAAGTLALATSLDLLLATIAGFDESEALALALFASTLLYVAARPWLLAKFALGGAAGGSEKLFDCLFRAARDIERDPAQAGTSMRRLLGELFDPLELAPHEPAPMRAGVSPDGSTLIVPLPRLADSAPEPALRLRHAQRGTRLFTREDARLIERVFAQLRRAVDFDCAVEHGRAEERVRIAQDLHDDIGARLLTLMYQAKDAEVEEYLRHTLQDLKTLTRGLAAGSQRLSHVAGEWKADLSQRLALAHCKLIWSLSIERDLTLAVTQWSALTRILRELVNNVIAHAQASEVEISLVCEGGQLALSVGDDGVGRAPDTWTHGLGLGGVRKRVRALDGRVAWRERAGRGICCEVRVTLDRTPS